jgi:hypothetical protein
LSIKRNFISGNPYNPIIPFPGLISLYAETNGAGIRNADIFQNSLTGLKGSLPAINQVYFNQNVHTVHPAGYTTAPDEIAMNLSCKGRPTPSPMRMFRRAP